MFKPKYKFTYDEIRIIVMALVELTEDQAMKMTKALVDRYRAKSAQEHSTPMREDYAR